MALCVITAAARAREAPRNVATLVCGGGAAHIEELGANAQRRFVFFVKMIIIGCSYNCNGLCARRRKHRASERRHALALESEAQEAKERAQQAGRVTDQLLAELERERRASA